MHDKKTILIIGPAPENTGGVSIHIRRLVSLLQGHYDFDFVDEGRKRWPGRFNIRSLRLITYIRKIMAADVVHIHSGSVILRIFNVLMAKWLLRKRTIVTVHRDPTIEKLSLITKSVLRKPDILICVNLKGINALSPGRKPGTTMHLPAFLPPVMEDEQPLPDEVNDFISNARAKGHRIMVSNASRLVMKDGTDLYGLDICVDALASLTESGLDWSLIFVVPDLTGSDEYLPAIRSRALSLGVADRMLIYTSALSFARLMQGADVVMRPTITDGDAITVREAIYFGIPVVASDVVERPAGTILHRSRDVGSLVEAIKLSVANHAASATEPTDYAKPYSLIYSDINQ